MQIALFRHREKKLLEQFAQAQRSKTLLFLQNQFSLPTEDCEDIFQEAFIVLYHNIQEGKLDELTSSLSTYFIAICKNKALEILRSKNKYASLNESDNLMPFSDQQVEKLLAYDTEDTLLQEQKETLVRTIVSDLPSPCNELLWGYYRDGLSMKALAERYNYASESAVKVTKHRCCEKFRNRFKESIKSLL